MFTSTVSLPTWFFLILLLAASYAVLMSVLFPSARWYLRRRLKRAVDKLNASLQIKIRPLQRTKRQVLIDQLMFDQEIIALIEAQAQQDNIPRDVLQQQVKKYAREIVPSFNAYIYYQVGYWLAKKVSRFIYRVRVAAVDPRGLLKVDPDATVVFVMNHRSNMDYVLISYLAAEQVTLSYAVGEWARIFPLEHLLRAMGAFFVRRNSQNPLYRKVLERYVYMATQSGVCQAVFLEGGLSRDGLLGEPKLGFLDYMLRNFDWRTDRNIVFVGGSTGGLFRSQDGGISWDPIFDDQNALGIGAVSVFQPNPDIIWVGTGESCTRNSIGWVVFGGLGLTGVFTLFLTPVIYLGVAQFSKARTAETRALEEELEEATRKSSQRPAE